MENKRRPQVFAVIRDENGEEKEVDMRKIVGSKGEKEDSSVEKNKEEEKTDCQN